MPISFWKDLSVCAGGSFNEREHTPQYILDGWRAAQRFIHDEEVLAAWLAGPFTYPRIAPESDLHMTVLIRRGEGRFYQHVLAPFSGVNRRLEIAFFPIDYFERLLERGFASWGDVFDGHKLVDIAILFDHDTVMHRIEERFESLRPGRMFVGAQIEALKAAYVAAGRSLDAARWNDAVQHARELSTGALKLLLVAAWERTFSKSSHLYSTLAAQSDAGRTAWYERAHGIAELDEESAARIVGTCSEVVRELFERQGVCAAGSD